MSPKASVSDPFVVRLARQDDVDGLLAIADAGGEGMTTVPNTRAGIAQRVEQSLAASRGSGPARHDEIFFFVLESGGAVVGLASLFPILGEHRPFYCYRKSRVVAAAPELGFQASSDLLYLSNDYHGYAEIGSLVVHEKLRGTGAGRLLSVSRFLFMQTIAERLPERVVAEIRGQFSANGVSPFWDAIASKFFNLSFLEADKRSANDVRFIADLMPKFPIYTALLPEDAQAVIGEPNDTSAPALSLLLSEGFQYNNCVDIFDAGPLVEAKLSDIRTVREAMPTKAMIADAPPEGVFPNLLVAKPHAEDFRCTFLPRRVEDGQLILTSEEASLLGVQQGDDLVTAPMKGAKAKP